MKVVSKKAWIKGFALASLLAAFFIGQLGSGDDNPFLDSTMLARYHIDHLIQEQNGLNAYAKDSLIGIVATGSSQGFGGPLEIIILSDTAARILDVELGENSETPSYVEKLNKKAFFRQFRGMELNRSFVLSDQVEAVSGATISSRAIASACREASWTLAADTFSLPLPELKRSWDFGLKEILASVVFVLALFTMFLKKKALRYIALFVSFITLGFMFNASLSVAYFGRLILGYLPDIREHFVWWLLLGGTIITIFIYGRNIYCHSICPFHGAQILLHKISGFNLSLRPRLNKALMKIPAYLLWLCLVLILISRNPTLSSFEPFSMLFTLEGAAIQWFILPLALLGSLVFSDFFCRFFCPVGAGFKFLIDGRRSLLNWIGSSDEKGPQ